MARLHPHPAPGADTGRVNTVDLAVAAITLRKRWPHAELHRDDTGNLWVDDGGDWVAKLDTHTGKIMDMH